MKPSTDLTEQEPSIYHTLDMIGGDPCKNCAYLEDLLKKIQHQRNKLYVALCDLYDLQNGPPLIENSKEYEDAMKKAQKIIKYIKEGK